MFTLYGKIQVQRDIQINYIVQVRESTYIDGEYVQSHKHYKHCVAVEENTDMSSET